MIYIIIATYNGAPWIRRCLDSLHDNSQSHRIVVIDNHSSDTTATIIETEYPWVHLIRSPINLGFGAANNIGISAAIQAEAEYIVLLNQDAYVLPDSLNQMQGFMSMHREFGVCSPIHCSPTCETLDRRTFENYLAKYATDLACDAILGQKRDHYTIYGLNAAFWFARREVFLSSGGFDPIFFMYGEDDDLLRRFAYHGIKFALLSNLRVVHLRQSPSVPAKSSLQIIRSLSSRRSAQLIVSLKNPKYSDLHALMYLLSKGFLNPIVDFPLNRNWTQLAGNLLAAVRALRYFPQISRHRRMLKSIGPWFLSPQKISGLTEVRKAVHSE